MIPMTEENVQFLSDIRSALAVDSQVEVFLRCGEFPFMLEPHGEKVYVRSKGEILGCYGCFDDMANNFLIEGKSFISRIAEIEYD